MRAFVLLFLGGGLIWGFLALSPNTTNAGNGEGGTEAGELATNGEADFVDDFADDTGGFDAGDTGQTMADETDNTPVVPVEPEVTIPRLEPSGGTDLPIGRADLVEIGATVLHASSRVVEDWLTISDGLLSSDLEHAIMVVSLAIEGDRSGARSRWKQIAEPDALSGRVRWLLTRSMAGDAQVEWPAKMAGGDPLEQGLSMALQASEANSLLAGQKAGQAAARISAVLVAELDAPWAADTASMKRWSEVVHKAQSRNRWHSKGLWPSIDMEVQPGDSLTVVRQRFVKENPGMNVSTGLIQKANGMSTDVIHVGQVLRIPSEPVTQLVDLGDHWLLYMIGGEVVESWPVGVGREGDETITGDFVVGDKQFEPTWWPKGRDPVYYGDPENPLGTRYIVWLQDGAKTSYGFHGTWAPESIGKNESDGCIRMENAAVEELYRILPVGSHFEVRF